MSEQSPNPAFRVYSLTNLRRTPSRRIPEGFQSKALAKLAQQFTNRAQPYDGGLLVLPTGGGKTFTAMRFLCTGPLSQGFRVLWLAHTHHLLDQAAQSLHNEAAQIHEPKAELHLRLVSGMHSPVHTIKPDDDVLLATLQTITRAHQQQHPALMAWLQAARNQLVVVFDEAHHAPAHSYRTLLTALRQQQPGLYVLGLTATPIYHDEVRGGWLRKLFPQEIVSQISAKDLMASGVLARPRLEEYRTQVEVAVDERDYQKWLGTYRDVPETIIDQLANNQARNQAIVQTYLTHRERFGKTIIFADRWYQCEYLCQLLQARGVRVDAVYSRVSGNDSGPGTLSRRTSDDNHLVLESFRQGHLDVLINVRMLTEGTDVPNVNTVFLTRQTTSSILLTQMIGRALRGPKFGGTAEAYIVSFVDNWKHLITWAEYELPNEDDEEEKVIVPRPRPPVYLVSIDLVRRLSRLMDTGQLVEAHPFLTLLPIGWYRVTFLARIGDSDDLEDVQHLAMVFEHEKLCYENLIAALDTRDLSVFGDEGVQRDACAAILGAWHNEFFAQAEEQVGNERLTNLFHIARHMAYHNGDDKKPQFFAFDEREHHDLDQVVMYLLASGVSRVEEHALLRAEYQRTDRYWSVLYPTYLLFKSQYDACVNRVLEQHNKGEIPDPKVLYPELYSEAVLVEIKRQVKQRDGLRCCACGETNNLEVDHIVPRYLGGSNDISNLQTLCRTCNQHKMVQIIRFLDHRTPLHQPPDGGLAQAKWEQWIERADNLTNWNQFLRRYLNFFYQCAAVESVVWEHAGQGAWRFNLRAGNDPRWLKTPSRALLERIVARRTEGGRKGPTSLVVSDPDGIEVVVRVTPVIEVGSTPLPKPEPDKPVIITSRNTTTTILGIEPNPVPTPTSILTKSEISRRGSSATEPVLGGVTDNHTFWRLPVATLPRHPCGNPGTQVAVSLSSRTVLTCSRPANATLVLLSNTGNAYSLPLATLATDQIESGPLSQWLALRPNETIITSLVVPAQFTALYTLILTSHGQIKRLALSDLLPKRTLDWQVLPPAAGIASACCLAADEDEVLVVTQRGQAIRFAVNSVPVVGRSAGGVKGIHLAHGDKPIGLIRIMPAHVRSSLCIITASGLGKRSGITTYPAQNRGGSGVRTTTATTRDLVAARLTDDTDDTDDLLVLTQQGMVVRLALSDLPQQGRSTQGIRLIALSPHDAVLDALVM